MNNSRNSLSLKTSSEIETISKGGILLSQILKKLFLFVRPGLSTRQIDQKATVLIRQTGGFPSFKKVPGYKHSTCLTVNDEVVHSLPTDYLLREGDILGIDIGLYYKGFHADTSITLPIAKVSPSTQRFLEAGKDSLIQAIKAAKPGNTVWDISKAMETPIKDSGFAPVQSLTGHGIGRSLHEPPAVPCFTQGDKSHSPVLLPGLVLALETIYNQGSPEVIYKNSDNWTIATRDGKLSAVFEATIVVTPSGPRILTPLIWL